MDRSSEAFRRFLKPFDFAPAEHDLQPGHTEAEYPPTQTPVLILLNERAYSGHQGQVDLFHWQLDGDGLRRRGTSAAIEVQPEGWDRFRPLAVKPKMAGHHHDPVGAEGNDLIRQNYLVPRLIIVNEPPELAQHVGEVPGTVAALIAALVQDHAGIVRQDAEWQEFPPSQNRDWCMLRC